MKEICGSWIKAHNGFEGNEIVDSLAKMGQVGSWADLGLGHGAVKKAVKNADHITEGKVFLHSVMLEFRGGTRKLQ